LAEAWRNRLYFGDNLEVLRTLPDGCVDLVYLDPPFNSGGRYGLLFEASGNGRSTPAVTAFADGWHWGPEAEEAYAEAVRRAPPRLGALLPVLRAFLGESDMLAYLAMMVPRLVELHRVLRPSGALYLHCDPSASHYLKVILDGVFGPERFRRELVWRSGWVSGFKAQARNWVRNHDVLLYYTRSEEYVFQVEETYLPHRGDYARRGGGGSTPGVRLDDVWTDIYSPMIMSFSLEKTGYPTQKPEALLERILRACSRPGDLVLDPFCGSGTTLVVAQRLGRRWIGIDASYLAVGIARQRLARSSVAGPAGFEVLGVPTDLEAAQALARRDPQQFAYWAIFAAGGRPARGADPAGGPEGLIVFEGGRALVRVAPGQVDGPLVRQQWATAAARGMQLVVLLCLEEPTGEARREAEAAGAGPGGCPRVQLLTVGDLLAGATARVPGDPSATFHTKAQAGRAARRGGDRGEGGPTPLRLFGP
jgi:DNA modification methylase